jgi:hypothetical protein
LIQALIAASHALLAGLSEHFPVVLVGTSLQTGILLREEVFSNAGEAELIVEAAETGRDTGCAGEIGGERVGANGALLHAAVRVVDAR